MRSRARPIADETTTSLAHSLTDAQRRRNVFVAAATGFMGFAGFTVVMPFLPLYISELGVRDVGEIAMWSGLTLGATPAITAISAPLWGRVGDRYGSKLLVIRSLRRVCADQGGDGVRHGAVATGRAARPARRVRRLRRADDVDGGGVGAARPRCRGRSASCRWASGSGRRSVRSSAA